MVEDKAERRKFKPGAVVPKPMTLEEHRGSCTQQLRMSGLQMCGERQTLIHVLNCCKVARDQQRYNTRHDKVLDVMWLTLTQNIDQPIPRLLM